MMFVFVTVSVLLLTETRGVAGDQRCNGSTHIIDLQFDHNGTINSPGYPYSSYEDCRWRIKAPYGEKVLIYFTKFDLRDCYNCDSVEIFDGFDSFASRLLSESKRSGSVLPPPVYSSGRYIYMRFTSSFGTADLARFVAHYRALSSSSGCPSIVPGDSAGVIYSPNFPWNYPYGISCDWNITVPISKMIKLEFTKFNLGHSYGYCGDDYVEVRDSKYGYQIGKYCRPQIPPSIVHYGSIHVRFYSDYNSVYSGFMAFYQTGYSFPTSAPYPYWTTYPYHWTTYYPYWTTSPRVYSPSAQSIYTCRRYLSETLLLSVKSSSSISIASSPDIDGVYPTSLPGSRCIFNIDTKSGYILELSFDQMSIRACSSCSCGYVKVKDGTTTSAQLLGTFCSGNYPDVVKSKGKQMSVEYYAVRRQDTFKATISSKKETPNVAGIVVPLVIAVVLFTIIFAVIKCTKIKRSTGLAAQSREVPLQALPYNIQQAPLSTERDQGLPQHSLHSPVTSEPLAPSTEIDPPHYSESLATASDPFPSSTGYSQGIYNMSLEDGTGQV